ncbi:hypothetical protein ACFQ1S_08395 [Kibdelosporangium lantanae]|uniref:DUF222 domain-containing protein n=1 Tax=Kibdelosporangium lantanae TaxID=1497396 RepID=A0ABW3M4N7_9PSEU
MQLSDAHLDALAEVVGDHHSLLVRCVGVDPQLGAAAVALPAEGGDPFELAHVSACLVGVGEITNEQAKQSRRLIDHQAIERLRCTHGGFHAVTDRHPYHRVVTARRYSRW